jgi:hypothetical protein
MPNNYSLVYPVGPYYQLPPRIYEAPLNTFAINQPLKYLTAAPQPANVYACNMAPLTPIYIPQRQLVYPPMGFDTSLMSPPNKLSTGTFSRPGVQTKAKVIIKRLPRDTSEAALINLINQFCSHSSSSRSHRSYSSSIQHIHLARHFDGRLKGHAFIIFETDYIAKKAVKAINGHKFQGRELRVTLAKEGVEPGETLYQQEWHGYLAPEKECMVKPNKGNEKAGESRSEDREASGAKNKDPMRGAPAVVDGSGRRQH